MKAEELPKSFFEEFHSSFKGDTYADCFPCGGCEYTLLAALFPGEATFIASKINVSKDEFFDKFVDTIQTTKFDIDLIRLTAPCPFLDNKYQCSIRDFKPILCEIYPLLITRKNDGTYSTEIDSWCPLSQQPKIADAFLQKWSNIESLFNAVDPEWLSSLEEFDEYYYDFHKLHIARKVSLNKTARVSLTDTLKCRIEGISAMKSCEFFKNGGQL